MDDDLSPKGLELEAAILAELRAALPQVAERTVEALTREVPEYGRDRIDAEMAANIQSSVELALATFLRLAAEGSVGGAGSGAPLAPVLEAAYALGRGEARSGRTMEALLGAYRVGARVAWAEQSALVVRRNVPAESVARYAELVFTYIDELSGASAAGHRDELARSGRVRDELLRGLANGLILGEPPDRLEARAQRAGWPPPTTLTAVALRSAHVGNVARLLDPHTLLLSDDVASGLASDELALLLVPDAHLSRAALVAVMAGRGAVVGPARPWTQASISFERVRRAIDLLPAPGRDPVDTDEHLVELTLGADPHALADLQARALAPLADLRPGTADRLAETLRSWLLHQGRRDLVAAELGVHAQTVRYRMGQVREHFGERLNEPQATLELVVALSMWAAADTDPAASGPRGRGRHDQNGDEASGGDP